MNPLEMLILVGSVAFVGVLIIRVYIPSMHPQKKEIEE